MNKYLAAAATTTAAVCATIATVGSAAASPTFGDGTYLVGTDIAPGQYAGSGQVDEHMGCYWERRSGTSGNFDEILANDYTHSGRVVVTILPSDYAFRSEDCGTWTRIGDVPAPDFTGPVIGSAVVGSAVVGSSVLPLVAGLLLTGSAAAS
ncbi:hypothetical protein G4H71_15390 [Rhodococcus triatomae]|uniref:Secreted protein n=1 Tax=Rhodococcus triatomae TaxID=300028 RepID=A0A1G8J145_9NOCA|nr:hypothetical protein [Rhodococcus triatomae]QNG24233.1 hypothetical protein G4H71_15390 [Rhodococcus triatomae]SDI24707.1 hypothetical protein SAMN05444695_10624 [Rhodococcus triatomae]